MVVEFGYGKKSINLDIPQSKLVGVYKPDYVTEINDIPCELKKTLGSPTGTKPLLELLSGKFRIVIVVDDISRPIPTRLILNPLLDFIFEKNVNVKDVIVLVATGVHRKLKQYELELILGGYNNRVSIINHDPDDDSNLISIGRTSFGNEVKINQLFCEADFRIIISDTEYHQFCGYGGGAKSVFPGLADRKSIENNHSRHSMPGSEKGEWKNNPVRQEIEEVGKMTNVDFLINVVLNRENKIIKIFSGDLKEAFLEGVVSVNSMNKRYIKNSVDLVISSPGGYPRDIDLYQSQKALETASKIVEQHGDIVILAECKEGYGSDLFHDTVKNANSIEDLITNHQKKFILGAHKAWQFARELIHANVYLYSSLKADIVRQSFIRSITMAYINKLIQSARKIAVLPYAASTHVVLKSDDIKEMGIRN